MQCFDKIYVDAYGIFKDARLNLMVVMGSCAVASIWLDFSSKLFMGR